MEDLLVERIDMDDFDKDRDAKIGGYLDVGAGLVSLVAGVYGLHAQYTRVAEEITAESSALDGTMINDAIGYGLSSLCVFGGLLCLSCGIDYFSHQFRSKA